ncbi:MAG: META domain-containing protein [Candidatus Methanoperedens sp.]
MIHVTMETWYIENEAEIDKVVFNLLKEIKLSPYSIRKLIFKICKNECDLINEKGVFHNRFLFCERLDNNEICDIGIIQSENSLAAEFFILKTDFNELLNKIIRRNIFHIIWISEIADKIQHIWEKLDDHEKSQILRAFWGQKFYVDSCAASKKFNSFIKNYSMSLNNFLSYHEMTVYEDQNKMITHQTEMLQNQNNIIDHQTEMLQNIHFVESGILILTFAIIFDIVFKVTYELTESGKISLAFAFLGLIGIMFIFRDTIKEMINHNKDSKGKFSNVIMLVVIIIIAGAAYTIFLPSSDSSALKNESEKQNEIITNSVPGNSTITIPYPVNINGTTWLLTSLNGSNLLENSNITMTFSDGLIIGFAGCNNYRGKYIAEDSRAIMIFEITSSEQVCQMPIGLMKQEVTYLESLQKAFSYRIIDNYLEVSNAKGETILFFITY